MSSRMLAGLLVAGCLTAAGGGAYVAVRQNAAASAAPAQAPVVPPAADPAARPVSETEAVVSAPSAQPPDPAAPAVTVPPAPAPAPAPVRSQASRETRPQARRETPQPAPVPRREKSPAGASEAAAPLPAPAEHPNTVVPPAAQQPEHAIEAPRAPEAPPAPEFEEVVLPSASVIGLQVDTALTSERARVEDRVDARVTRDVMADGRVAIPAGARVIGSVTTVERGGKMKERARLGVRFHTLVLADGREVPLRTETIYREGESPTGESARKIGGAAIGGAILGAIMGGGKGAAIGATTGAAGGTAVVMAGDRNAATLPPGTVVTVRLSAPATLEVQKREQ